MGGCVKCNICLERCEVTVLVSSSSRSVYMYIELCGFSHAGSLCALWAPAHRKCERPDAESRGPCRGQRGADSRRGGLDRVSTTRTTGRRARGYISRSSPCLSGF
eukprot:scaffold16356_cov63-Phaeocystis_antarctica.AAC.3